MTRIKSRSKEIYNRILKIDGVSNLLKKKKYSDKVNNINTVDPTRYGDWEKSGRCTDF